MPSYFSPLHSSLLSSRGDGIPWDPPGSQSQISLRERRSDAAWLPALDPEAAPRPRSLFITASPSPDPCFFFARGGPCSQLTQAVGDPESSCSPWDRSHPAHSALLQSVHGHWQNQGPPAPATGKMCHCCVLLGEPSGADSLSSPPLFPYPSPLQLSPSWASASRGAVAQLVPVSLHKHPPAHKHLPVLQKKPSTFPKAGKEDSSMDWCCLHPLLLLGGQERAYTEPIVAWCSSELPQPHHKRGALVKGFGSPRCSPPPGKFHLFLIPKSPTETLSLEVAGSVPPGEGTPLLTMGNHILRAIPPRPRRQ